MYLYTKIGISSMNGISGGGGERGGLLIRVSLKKIFFAILELDNREKVCQHV